MVVITAIAMGLWSGVSTMAFLNGWLAQRIDNSINNETSHIQIHHPDFLLNQEVDKFFRSDSVQKIMDTIPEITGYSKRLKTFAMAQSDRASTGLMVLAVDPKNEQKISGIPKNIILGNFLKN
ncbi:MAG: hypothetical protein H5T24_00655, partial [Bacteroidales bacterium]|nr:hypothetical protein [Bacteroidales bacterium]